MAGHQRSTCMYKAPIKHLTVCLLCPLQQWHAVCGVVGEDCRQCGQHLRDGGAEADVAAAAGLVNASQ